MIRHHNGILVLVLLAISASSAWAWQRAKKPVKSKPTTASGADPVLVIVNGEKVTESDLVRRMTTRQVPEEERERFRGPYLEKLIDARLIQQFLASRKTAATNQELDEQVKLVRENARKSGRDPDKVLAESGYTPESLREELA